jgi:phosphoglycerate dehydrogenase-like enzyme
MVLGERSRELIKMHELKLMKSTAFLINTSRGPLIREADLIEILRERKIKGAALDVYDTEPLNAGHPFRKLDNVLATPHIGFVTEETYRLFYQDTVRAMENWLATH